MSVRPIPQLVALSLNGAEGILISINITVEACGLEALLEALAQLDYPINPQIYHQGVAIYRTRDGREHSEPTTIVDFPAYASWVADIRHVLPLYGFDPASVHVFPMLDELHGGQTFRPAPDGSGYAAVLLIKQAPIAACV